MGKRLYFLIILFVSLLSTHFISAQCNSKVKANAKLISNELGEIKVDISTTERFECKLNTVSGKGQELVSLQTGNGSVTITFSDLDRSIALSELNCLLTE